MKIQRKFWLGVMGAICLMLGAGVLYGQMSQSNLKSAPVSGAIAPETLPPGSKYSGSPMQVRLQSWQQLRTLWRARDTKPVVQDVLPFATHPLLSVQLVAVRMLGRLEDPAALEVLQSLDKSAPRNADWMSEPYGLSLYPTLPLAIGRIKSRDLEGQEKVQRMLTEVGLTVRQLSVLSEKIANEPYGSQAMADSVVWEVTDILYQQKKSGADTEDLTEKLTLRPPQKALLQNASRPLEEEANGLLNYLSTTRIVGEDESRLIDMLFDLDPKAENAAIDFANKIFADRQKYPSPLGYIEVLKTLAEQNPDDTRIKSLLLKFSKDKSTPVRQQAGGALYRFYGIILSP